MKRDTIYESRGLTQSEARKFKDIIPPTKAFWTKDGGYVFGGEYRAGIVYEGNEVGTCSAVASAVGVRPALTLNPGGITMDLRKLGDQIVFTHPETKQEERFTYLGISDDNKFLAICNRVLATSPFAEREEWQADDYEKSVIKPMMVNAGVNLREWGCRVEPAPVIEKDAQEIEDDDIER